MFTTKQVDDYFNVMPFCDSHVLFLTLQMVFLLS